MVQVEHERERNWQACLADMAFACGLAQASQTGTLLRAVHDLLRDAPRSWHACFQDLLCAQALDAHIAAGAEVVAAMAMIDGRGSYMLSHGPDSKHMATVIFEGFCEEASAEGETAALALLGAMAAALAGSAFNLGYEQGFDLAMPIPALRLN